MAEEALLVLLCATLTPALLERITTKCEKAASHHSNSRNNTQDCNIQHACSTAPSKLFDADGTCPAVRAAQFETAVQRSGSCKDSAPVFVRASISPSLDQGKMQAILLYF